MRRLLLLIVALAAIGAGALTGGRDEPPGAGGRLEGRVVRIVDGDTIHVAIAGGRREKVRYIGIDTPESVKPDTPVQCFAKAASAANARLVAGRRVELELDAEQRDRYGRLLAYVRRDGLFVNAELVRRGYAVPLTIPPNVRYAARFRDLARAARKAGTGLWSACER